MSIDEQPMNVYWSGKRTETSNNFKINYKGSVATKNSLPSLSNKIGDMYNVAESGENFIWNGNFWDNLSGDILKILNWQKSEKASTVVIYPVSETAIEPVVDFLFVETSPASGDKAPDNPSTIAGVSSITVTRCETVGVNSTDYTVNLGSTFYGGTLDVASGIMTQTHDRYVFSSFSSVTSVNDNTITFSSSISGSKYKMSLTSPYTYTSNLFEASRSTEDFEHIRQLDTDGQAVRIFVLKSRLDVSSAVDPSNPTNEEWLAAGNVWIANNNIEFIYKRAVTRTVQRSPVQISALVQTDKYVPQINTVYSNQQSVQVGYAKSPIQIE